MKSPDTAIPSRISDGKDGPLLHHYLSLDKQKRLRDEITPGKEFKQIRAITKKLWLTGSESSLNDLKAIANSTDDPLSISFASREVARWHLHQGDADSIRIATKYSDHARVNPLPTPELSKALLLSAICDSKAIVPYARSSELLSLAIRFNAVSPDLLLSLSSARIEENSMLRMINHALSYFRISPISLNSTGDRIPFDRLSSQCHFHDVSSGPKVSVLIATYTDADTLPTALRSLQEQTWKNCEFIIIDDCSPDPAIGQIASRFADSDTRFRYIRQSQNMGAYVARNAGLDIATGDFITLHDADDWSHPLKIETQVKYMCNHPNIIACTSEQARCTSRLEFNQLRSNDGIVFLNTSSLMWRRKEVRERLGYWDTVRFGADSEFVKRLRIAFGSGSIVNMATGPLSFQRQGEENVTSGRLTGLSTLRYGVRKEYAESSEFYHRSGKGLRYENNPMGARHFPAPRMMLPVRDDDHKTFRLDVVIIGDILEDSTQIPLIIELIKSHITASPLIGLIPIITGDRRLRSTRVSDQIRRVTIEHGIYLPVYGETVLCKLAVLTMSVDLDYRHMPTIKATEWTDSSGSPIEVQFGADNINPSLGLTNSTVNP